MIEDGSIAPEINAELESQPMTKTSLSVDGGGVGTIYWNPKDSIDVFFGTTRALYTSQNTSDTLAAVFKTNDTIGATESSSTNIWGLYPSYSSSSCDGTSVTTVLPSSQYGVPGTFDDDIYLAVAHSTSTSLQFYNVCGGIKFSMVNDDIASVTFRGNNNEYLAGEISISFQNGLPQATIVNGVKEITLTPKTDSTFINGEDYYITLLPAVLSSGFTMTFTATDGTTGTLNYTDKSVTIKRSVFSRKSNIDVYASFDDDRQPNNVIYYTSSNGQIVTPYATDVFGANIVSNEYVNGLGIITFDGDVTSIGDWAFAGCSLTSIAIPSSVSSIGNYALAGCSFTSIDIPSSVSSIGNYAFADCDITSITIPSSVISIGDFAFNACNNLNSVILSDGINSVGISAFADCANLSSVTIANSVTSIGKYAFYNCESLTSITLPSSLTSIEEGVFANCHSLAYVSTPEGLKSVGDFAFYGCSFSSFTIPSSVTSIGYYAFYHCDNLTSITIPDNVTIIRQDTFSYCLSLSSITLSSSLKIIEAEAFSHCSSLPFIILPLSVTVIGQEAFNSCSSLSSITIPSSVNVIDSGAFADCSGLTSITVKAMTPPQGYQGMFYNTNNCPIYVPAESVQLYKQSWSAYADRIQAMPQPNNVIYYTSSNGQIVTPYATNVFGANIVSNEYVGGQGVMTFDGDVTQIGQNAFQGCVTLSSVDIPKSVTVLGSHAFWNCSGLTSIEIPNSVTSIGINPFAGCTDMTTIVVESDNPVFDSRNNCNAVIETDSGDLVSGCKSTVIPNSVTSIASWGFQSCSGLTSIEIPNSVTFIGQYAFQDCSGLTSIEIPSSVTIISNNPFYGCSGLTSMIVASDNPVYDSRNNCNAIIKTTSGELISGCQSTVIPNSVTGIGPYAFYGCTGLTSIEIPDPVTVINQFAFYGCTGLTSVTISHSITTIGSNAFERCSGLGSVTIFATSPPSLGSVSFRYTNNCPIYVPAGSVDAYKSAWSAYADRIQAMTQPNNVIYYTSTDGRVVTPYAAGVFGANIVSNEYVDGQGIITFDGEVTSIGERAFYSSSHSCDNLSSIVIPSTVTSIGYCAFYCCESMESVVIPDSVTSIGDYAFRYCRGLSSIDIPNSVTTIGDFAFETCIGLTSIEIPNSVTNIGQSAFAYCSGLTSIEIPSSVTSLGLNPFAACSELSSIIVDSNNPVYDSRDNCNAIIHTASNELVSGCKNTVIPNTVTRIRGWAFLACTGLTSIEIPDSITFIIHEAFLHCSNLTSITVYAVSPPSINDDTVFDDTNDCPIYVPAGSVDAYKSAWSAYADRIQVSRAEYAVDLGLSVKWASCNIGASSPEDYGDYYAWGETETKNSFSWENYKFRANGNTNDNITFTKYNTKSGRGTVDNKTSLVLSDDAARVNWGGNWRIPTKAEIDELKSNCTMTFTSQGGVNGYNVTSNKNGNSIFLPAKGFWSSSLNTDYPNYAWQMNFPSSQNQSYDHKRIPSAQVNYGYLRYQGLSIRPVTD